jgi:hypothetical protein
LTGAVPAQEFIMPKLDITHEAAVRSDLAHDSLTAIDRTVEQTSVAPAQLPQLQAPNINDFLKDHGIASGQDGPIGDIDIGNVGIGPDYGSHGSMGSIPGISGIPDFGGDPSDDNSSGPLSGNDRSGTLIPGLGGSDGGPGFGNDISGLGLPKDLNIGGGTISNLSAPDDFDSRGGISSPAVPGGSGHVGSDGGFTASDFRDPGLTDSPDDGSDKGGARVITVGDAVISTAIFGRGLLETGAHDVNHETSMGGIALGIGEAMAGAFISTGAILGGIAAIPEASTVIYVSPPGDNTPPPAQGQDDPPPNPDPNPSNGNQPVDDSGAGHPGTHTNEQPVDDSGSGSGGFHPLTANAEQPVDDTRSGSGFHPLTNSTAQPVDDSGTTPRHPGTHLGAVTADLASAGHGASFSDAASAALTSTSASLADSGFHTTQNISMGMFEHAALAPTSSASIVDHATADLVTTTHSIDAHSGMSLSHQFELNLDLSHLSAHAL